MDLLCTVYFQFYFVFYHFLKIFKLLFLIFCYKYVILSFLKFHPCSSWDQTREGVQSSSNSNSKNLFCGKRAPQLVISWKCIYLSTKRMVPCRVWLAVLDQAGFIAGSPIIYTFCKVRVTTSSRLFYLTRLSIFWIGETWSCE